VLDSESPPASGTNLAALFAYRFQERENRLFALWIGFFDMTRGVPRMNRNIAQLLKPAAIIAITLFAAVSHAAPGGVSDGLKVWLRASTGIDAVDGGPVTFWADESGQENHAEFNPANIYGEQPPLYVSSNPDAGGQSTVLFLNQNALEIDLSWLAGSDYTIFVVNSRNRFGLANFYIAGDSLLDNSNLTLGYEQTALLRQAHFNNDLDAIVEQYFGVPIWSLDSFRFAQAEGRDLFHNGSPVASDDNALALLSNSGTTLGHFRAFGNLFWFQGELAEVVVYDRALTAEERLLVEADLAGRNGGNLNLDDYVPCTTELESHGAYVSQLAHAANVFKKAGLLTAREAGRAISRGANSDCGQ
jgi:hypothetical protein